MPSLPSNPSNPSNPSIPVMPSLFDIEGELICGVDEAGRGPLAGPVFAAAVILDLNSPLVGLRDSKNLPLSVVKN